jgi:hypothetical protein
MTDQTVSPSDNPAQLWAIEDIQRLRMHNGMTLLVARATGAKLPVSEAFSLALWECQCFRTLDAHVAQMTSAYPNLAEQSGQLLQLLQTLRDTGLMVSAEQVCARVNAAAEPVMPAQTRVFIITCDRPAAVERLLETLLGNARLSQHEAFYLIDDSRSEENAARNRELAESFSISSPVSMHYVGAPEQARLMDALIAAAPEHEAAIRFLIDRERWRNLKSYGLSRTLSLLLSVGRRCIVLDDDVVCASFRVAEAERQVNLNQAPLETEYYATMDEWRQQAVATELDPLAGHATCLGRNFSDALGRLGVEQLQPEQLRGSSAMLSRSSRADSRVLITQCGSLGDPGTEGNSWVYTLPQRAVEAMLAAPGGVEQALVNRQNWVGYSAPTFVKMASMSQVTGLDNTALLPPYFPVFRGEDALFGSMLAVLHPQAMVLEYDWAVPHLPLEQRVGNPLGDLIHSKGGLSIALNYMFDALSIEAEVSAETRLQTMAAILTEFSQLPDTTLRGLFYTEVAQAQTANFSSIDGQLHRTGKLGESWAQFLQQQLQHVLASMQQVAQITQSHEVPAGATEEQVIAWFRQGVSEFAGVLAGWVAIREAAGACADAAILD